MYNILTRQDFDILISLSESKINKIAPVSSLKNMKYNDDSIIESKKALEKIGFVQNGELSKKGKLITDALMTPADVVITTNTALIDHAPISYCYRNGFWTVLAPDIETNLITIVSPVFVKDIKHFAKSNMLYDLKIASYEPFTIELTDNEILIFEMSQLIIINRFKEKKSPLAKEESWFKFDDLFGNDVSFYMITSSDYISYEKRNSLSEMLSDEMGIKNALVGLVRKGLLEMVGENPDLNFSHTRAAHKWLMADSMLDKIAIYKASSNMSYSYRITSSGILKVSTVANRIRFKSVPDLELEVFDNV